jgi:hypothetical protein
MGEKQERDKLIEKLYRRLRLTQKTSKPFDIQLFYAHFAHSVKLVDSISGLWLSQILKACQYIPRHWDNSNVSKENYQAKYHKWWVNCYGDEIKIDPALQAKFSWTEASTKALDHPKPFDIYYSLPIERILKINKRAYVSSCVEPDSKTRHVCLATYGEDNLVRGYTHIFDTWYRFCPMKFGLDFVMNLMQIPSTYVLDRGMTILPIVPSDTKSKLQSWVFDGADVLGEVAKTAIFDMVDDRWGNV